jgi:hypothetical protein
MPAYYPYTLTTDDNYDIVIIDISNSSTRKKNKIVIYKIKTLEFYEDIIMTMRSILLEIDLTPYNFTVNDLINIDKAKTILMESVSYDSQTSLYIKYFLKRRSEQFDKLKQILDNPKYEKLKDQMDRMHILVEDNK